MPPCDEVNLELKDGTPVQIITCSRGQRHASCASCGKRAPYLCDAKVTRNGKPATCDRPMCARCRVPQAPGVDFCGPHARAAETNKAVVPEKSR